MSEEGSYCEFWLPRRPWHNLPLRSVQHFAVTVRLECWAEDDAIFHSVRGWRRFRRSVLRIRCVTLEPSTSSLEDAVGRLRAHGEVNIQCTILTERTEERKAGSEVQVLITDL